MGGALVALALAPLGKEAVKLLAGFAVAMVLSLAFVVSSVAAMFGAFTGAAVTTEGGTTLAGRLGLEPEGEAGLRFPSGLSALPTRALVPGAPAPTVLEIARSQIGRPYVWGGASPTTSFDCSGLVQWAYAQVGVSLPRTAQQQFNATARIAASELQPGDLVFFQTYLSFEPITHVGIYVGNGRMIDAPTEGAFIREESIDTPYWRAHWAGAGRAAQ